MTTFKAEYGKDSFNISVLLHTDTCKMESHISLILRRTRASSGDWQLERLITHRSDVISCSQITDAGVLNIYFPFSFLGCPTLC